MIAPDGLRTTALLTGAAVLATALALGALLVSTVCRLSRRWGAIDRPDGDLKRHSRPTATLGGLAVFAALLGALLPAALVGWGLPQASPLRLGGQTAWGGILVASLVMLLLGVSDDLRHILPRVKIIFQLVAGAVLVAAGLLIQRCDFFGIIQLPCAALAIPFTLFWVVGSSNAFNFLDGMDGLASGVGVVASLTLALVGFANGCYGPALLALALAGALLALLLFNLRPAAIFLGDSGSQLTGMLLGLLAIEVFTVRGVFYLPAAGLVLSVPVLDTFLAVLRRYSRIESPAHGDHHHIHHCLRRRGLSETRTSAALWMVSALAGVLAAACYFACSASLALAAVTFVALELYAGVRLGCLDLANLVRRLRRAPAPAPTPAQPQPGSAAQALAQVEALWERLKPFFEQMHLDRAVLTLDAPSPDGRVKRETYQWVRSGDRLAELLTSRWTKRFLLDTEPRRVATLRLEAADRWQRDEQRIQWLVRQISENVRLVQEQPPSRRRPARPADRPEPAHTLP